MVEFVVLPSPILLFVGLFRSICIIMIGLASGACSWHWKAWSVRCNADTSANSITCC